MELTIIHYTVLVIALVVVFVLNNRKAQQAPPQSNNLTKTRSRPPGSVDATPDEPTPFGYKCIWFAIKSTNADDVVKEIGLKSPVPCNWKSGIAAAYEGGVFVSPAVDGWTLVIGQDLPTLDDAGDRRKQTNLLLVKLSQHFGETQHFGTHRVSDFHAWAKALNGKIVREFAYVAGEEKLCDVGDMTDEEHSAGITNSPDFFVNENHVMKVAEKWSLDPCKLTSKSAEKGVGWLGNL